MNYFIISDTHFGHQRMVDLGYREDGFEHEIFRQLSFYLKPDDVLIHMGDVCIGHDALYNTMVTTFCKSWLIKGNHDNKTYSWYLSHGWDVVADSLEICLFGKNIVFSHIPVKVRAGRINIHGHLHSTTESHRLEGVKDILTCQHHLVSIEGAHKVFNLKKFVGM